MSSIIEQFAAKAVRQLPPNKITDPTELMQLFSEHFATLIIGKCIDLVNDPVIAVEIKQYFGLQTK